MWKTVREGLRSIEGIGERRSPKESTERLGKMQLYSYRRTKDIYRHLASYKPASLSLSFESDIYDIEHTYIYTAVNTYCTPPSSFEV